MSMELNKLNSFSTFIYGLLVEIYPQWSSLIRIAEDDEESIILKIPSPQSVELNIEVSTYNEEITVAFGSFHSHFGWPDVPDEEAFQEAAEMINEIITGKLLIAEFTKDGKIFQSETVLEDELESYLELGPELRVIGWNNSYVGR